MADPASDMIFHGGRQQAQTPGSNTPANVHTPPPPPDMGPAPMDPAMARQVFPPGIVGDMLSAASQIPGDIQSLWKK